MSDEDQSKSAPSLGPRVMAAIGRELRLMYADIIAEGVPERFAAIVRNLDEASNEGENRYARDTQQGAGRYQVAVVPVDGAGPVAKPGIADTLEEARAALAARYDQVKRGGMMAGGEVFSLAASVA